MDWQGEADESWPTSWGISEEWGEDRLYSFQGKKKEATLREATFDQHKHIKGVVFSTLDGRCKKDKRKKNDNSNKAIMFSDYRVEQPLVPPAGRGKGAGWARMGPTKKGVTMFRFVWRKEGTPEQRLEELNALLAEHGIFLD